MESLANPTARPCIRLCPYTGGNELMLCFP
jgi:hypothetical protein